MRVQHARYTDHREDTHTDAVVSVTSQTPVLPIEGYLKRNRIMIH